MPSYPGSHSKPPRLLPWSLISAHPADNSCCLIIPRHPKWIKPPHQTKDEWTEDSAVKLRHSDVMRMDGCCVHVWRYYYLWSSFPLLVSIHPLPQSHSASPLPLPSGAFSVFCIILPFTCRPACFLALCVRLGWMQLRHTPGDLRWHQSCSLLVRKGSDTPWLLFLSAILDSSSSFNKYSDIGLIYLKLKSERRWDKNHQSSECSEKKLVYFFQCSARDLDKDP